MTQRAKKWTAEELEILRTNLTDRLPELLPDRSWRSITRARHRYGVKWTKAWTEKEDKIILDNPESTYQEIKEMLPNKSVCAIAARSRQHGLVRPKDAVSRARTCGLSGLSIKEIDSIRNNKKFNDFIDGCLLGDGCVQNSRFSYGSTSRGHAEALLEEIRRITGIERQISTKKPRTSFIKGRKIKTNDVHSLCWKNKMLWASTRERWYPDGFKRVPDDVSMSSVACLFWYLGDGCLSSGPSRRSVTIILCTDGFLEEDVVKLSKMLSETVSISARAVPVSGERGIRRDGGRRHQVHITGPDVLKFLEYIGPCPVNDYKHKWDIKGYRLIKFDCPICGKLIERVGRENSPYTKTCSRECYSALLCIDGSERDKKIAYLKEYRHKNHKQLREKANKKYRERTSGNKQRYCDKYLKKLLDIIEAHNGKLLDPPQWKGAQAKYRVECGCGHIWAPWYSNLLSGQWCPKCGFKNGWIKRKENASKQKSSDK